MKIFIGIIIGIVLAISVTTAYASNKQWSIGWGTVERLKDGNITCYTYSLGSNWGSISCVKVK